MLVVKFRVELLRLFGTNNLAAVPTRNNSLCVAGREGGNVYEELARIVLCDVKVI